MRQSSVIGPRTRMPHIGGTMRTRREIIQEFVIVTAVLQMALI